MGTEDDDDKNPVVQSDGTNELTCFGAYYDHAAQQLELQIGNKGGTIYPNHDDSTSDDYTAQRYWIHFTPNFGPYRGREQVIEVFQGHEDPDENRPDELDYDKNPEWKPRNPWVLACLLPVPEARQTAGYRSTSTPARDADNGGGRHCDPQVAGSGPVGPYGAWFPAAVDKETETVTYVTIPLEQSFGPVVPGARFDDVWVEAWHVPGANAEAQCGMPDPPGASSDVWRWEGLVAGPACVGAGVGVDHPAGTPPSVEPPKVDVDASSMFPVIDDIAGDCKDATGNQTPHPVSILFLTYDVSVQHQPCFQYQPSSGDPVPTAPGTSAAGVCDSTRPGYASAAGAHPTSPFILDIIDVCIVGEDDDSFDIVVNYANARERPPPPGFSPMTMVMMNVCEVNGGPPTVPVYGSVNCGYYGVGWTYEWTAGGCLDKHPTNAKVCYLFVYMEKIDPTANGTTPLMVAGGMRQHWMTFIADNPNNPTTGSLWTTVATKDDPIHSATMFGNELRFVIQKPKVDFKFPGSLAQGGAGVVDGSVWKCLVAGTWHWFNAEITGTMIFLPVFLERTSCGSDYPFPGYAKCKASFQDKKGQVGERITLKGSLSGCSDQTICTFTGDGSEAVLENAGVCPKHSGMPDDYYPPGTYVMYEECGEYEVEWEVYDPKWPLIAPTRLLRNVTVFGDACIPGPPDEYVVVKWDGVEIEDGNLSQSSAITMRDVWSTVHDLSEEIADKGGVLAVNGEHTIRAEWYIDLEGTLFLVDVDEIVVEVQLSPTAQSGSVPPEGAIEDGRAEDRLDSDRDGIIDASDNCPRTPNTGQDDLDQDTLGDACDSDIDGDGWFNHVDNCPRDVDPDRIDSDSDGKGDLCDDDDDNDGIKDGVDNCPLVANKGQVDSDEDGLGDACDGDRDGDGSLDHFDAFPDDPLQWADRDGDGFGDNPGKNGDNCPTIRNPDQLDSDSNGVGDACEGLVESAASGQSWSIPGELEPLDADVEAPESKSPFQGLSVAIVLAVIGLALIGLLAVRTLRRE